MEKINKLSFIFAIICILLLYIVSFSGLVDFYIGINPLNLVLYITMLNFILGVLGFSGIQNRYGKVRSIATIIITSGLLVFLAFVIFFGNLLG